MDIETMALRTVIRGGTIVTTEGEMRADVVIDDNKIIALLLDSDGVDGDTDIDANDLLVLPGMVETWFPAAWLHDINASDIAHHMQVAALAGGLTTVAAEPGDAPTDVGTPSHLSLDAGLWLPVVASAIPGANQLARMKSVGMIGVSADMTGDDGLTDGELYQLMQVLAQQDVPLAIQPLHAEVPSRDPIGEELAANTLMTLAEHTGTWVHLHGITNPAAIRIAMAARDRGVNVTTSVPALHLALATESGRSLRVRPPLRPQRLVDELWEYVLAEQIDCVSVTPVRFGDKGQQTTDAQTAMSMFWHEAVGKRGMSRSQAVRMLSTNPAQILGLFPRKGAIHIGSDADVVLFDPEATWTATNADSLDGTGSSPVNSMEIGGFVVRTLSHGRTVYDAEHHEDDSLVIPGTGKLLNRT